MRLGSFVCCLFWAPLAVSLVLRHLELYPWLEGINVGWAALAGLVTGICYVGALWQQVHRQERDCLRKVSARCRLELEARGYFDIDHPFTGADAGLPVNVTPEDAARL